VTAVKPVHLGRQKLVPGSRDARLFHGLSLRPPLIFLTVFEQCDLIHDYRSGGSSADASAFHFRNASSLTPGLDLIRAPHAACRAQSASQYSRNVSQNSRDVGSEGECSRGRQKDRRGVVLRASAALLQRADQSVSTTVMARYWAISEATSWPTLPLDSGHIK
jgi:hypothetical protein